MEMDLNNRLTEDETLEQAYDIFSSWRSIISTLLTSFFSTCNLKSVAVLSCSIRLKTGPNTSILISTRTSSLRW